MITRHAAASFLGMWLVMMVPMMLPAVAPELWRYHQAVGRTGEIRPGRLTALAGFGYFFTWTVFGIAAFPLGVALAHAAPIVSGLVVLTAGAFQLTTWKARQLARCREIHSISAWRHGLRLGLHCGQCCLGLMAIPLAIGMMDLHLMALVSAAITAERLAPSVARATGTLTIGAGLFLIARSAGQ
jgi:predicted metal-binding membrane protein